MWLRNHVAGVDDKVRPGGQGVDDFHQPAGAGQGIMAVPAVIGRWPNVGIANVDKVEGIG